MEDNIICIIKALHSDFIWELHIPPKLHSPKLWCIPFEGSLYFYGTPGIASAVSPASHPSGGGFFWPAALLFAALFSPGSFPKEPEKSISCRYLSSAFSSPA